MGSMHNRPLLPAYRKVFVRVQRECCGRSETIAPIYLAQQVWNFVVQPVMWGLYSAFAFCQTFQSSPQVVMPKSYCIAGRSPRLSRGLWLTHWLIESQQIYSIHMWCYSIIFIFWGAENHNQTPTQLTSSRWEDFSRTTDRSIIFPH